MKSGDGVNDRYVGLARLADPKTYAERFRSAPPPEAGKADLWPGYRGSFIRRHPHADVGDGAVPER